MSLNKPANSFVSGFKNRDSLKHSLTRWFLLLSLIPLLLFSFASYLQTQMSLKHFAQEELKQSSSLTKLYISNWFDYRFLDVANQSNIEVNVRFIESMIEGWQQSELSLPAYARTQPSALDKTQLASWAKQYDYISDVLLIDKLGNVLFNLNNEYQVGTNILNDSIAGAIFKNTFSRSLISGDILYSPLERSPQLAGKVVSYITAPVNNALGETVGGLAISINLKKIFSLLNNGIENDSSLIHYIVRNDGVLLSPLANDWQVLTTNVNSEQLKLFDQQSKSILKNHIDFAFEYVGPQGQEVLGIHQEINIAGVKWILISEINRDEALAAADWLAIASFLMFLVISGLVIIAALYKAKRITAPIIELVNASLKISEGKTTLPVVVDCNNEIGLLADSFNHMMSVRTKYEQALEGSTEQAHKALTELANQRYAIDQHSIVIATDLKGDITFANQNFTDISGYKKNELIGSNHRILHSDIHDDWFWERLYSTFGSGEVWQGEICNIHKHGNEYWVETTAVKSSDENGKIVGVIIIFSDITERKLGELALAESSRQLELVIDNTDVGVWDWQIGSGEIIANDRWAEISGHTLKQLEPLNDVTWDKLIHPQDLINSKKQLQQHWRGETDRYTVEQRIMHQRGHWVWVLCTGRVVERHFNGKPKRMIGTYLDLSEQKKAEVEGAKTLSLLESTLESTETGMMVTNENGMVLKTNGQLSKLLKVPNQITKSNSLDIIFSDICARVTNPENINISQHSGPDTQSFTLKFIDGCVLEVSSRAMFINHQITGRVWSFQDVSARKKHEQEQQQQHHNIQIKLAIAKALSKSCSLSERLEHALEELIKLDWLSGQGRAEIYCTDLWESALRINCRAGVFHKNDIANDDLILRAMDERELMVLDGFIEINALESQSKTYNFVVPLSNRGIDAESVLGVLYIYVDEYHEEDEKHLVLLEEISDMLAMAITQHNARELLKEATITAEQNSQLKSEFLASMSHEIRTPMNGVLGMLGLLLNGHLSDSQRHKANLAKSSAQSLLTLINDILDFSKVEAGKLDLELIDFDLRAMLGEFAESIALKAQNKGLELIIDLTQIEQSMVQGDPGRLRQILTNLVGNSIKFTHSGEISIRAQVMQGADHGLIFHCLVDDTGIGIPENKIATLFESFTQVDASTTRKYGGTGLGLSICKKLCEVMEGNISVRSELGQGSVFEFFVVLHECETSVPVVPSQDLSSMHFLVVDDNETSCEVIAEQLTHWGAQVTKAHNATEAIEFCLQYDAVGEQSIFNAAFIDLDMDQVSGIECVEKIREIAKCDPMKILVMTALENNFEPSNHSILNINGHFPKPVITVDLIKAMTQICHNDFGEHLKDNCNDNDNDDVKKWQQLDYRILLVEDNYINQLVAMGVLEQFGLEATIANNGLEALDKLKQSDEGKPYHMLLMDCQMPEMDGYQATINIRSGAAGQHYRDIAIVAMTANAMAGDREKCLDCGMSDYLTKPIEPQQFLEKLRQWLPSDVDEKIAEITDEPTTVHIDENSQIIQVTVINEEIWDRKIALSRVMNNEPLLRTIIVSYFDEIESFIGILNQAVTTLDMDKIRYCAHAVKGMSGNISGLRLQQAAAELEAEAKLKPEDDIIHLVENFLRESAKLNEVLTGYINAETTTQIIAPPQSSLSQLIKQLHFRLTQFEYVDSQEVAQMMILCNNEKLTEDFKLLEQQVSQFDSTSAVKTLELIAKQLTVTIDQMELEK